MSDFERRLENWGMLYRNDRGRPATSPTYDVCRQIAIQRGGEVHDGYREARARAEIDEDDARIIEWCWCQSRFRMDAKHWALLRAHYVAQSDPRLICRLLQVRWRSFDATRVEAVDKFERCVSLLTTAQKLYNPQQDNQTTAIGV